MPIIISNHQDSVFILNSTFAKNLGIYGIVYLDFKHTASGRAFISATVFKNNTGVLKSSALYLIG